MDREWDKLREFGGSIENAFEELCAQMARADSEAASHSFERNGKPDGGLECHALRQDGTQIGWQAKWFRSPPKKSQWAQLTESFETALATYPNLQEFIVCLPQDRSHAKTGAMLTRDRWDAAVQKWTTHAVSLGRTVKVTYWGTSELFDRLSKPAHSGRRKFWFDKEFLEPKWFRARFDEAWANNKRRYLPHIDVAIPGTHWFDPLLQTSSYTSTLRALLAALVESLWAMDTWKSDADLKDIAGECKSIATQLHALSGALPDGAEKPIPRIPVEEAVKYAASMLHRASSRATDDRSGTWSSSLHKINDAISEIGDFVDGPDSLINTQRVLLAVGDAGQGKTHLLFKTVDELTSTNMPAVITCGADYSKGDPWTQMLSRLGMTCGRDEFLGALNAAAEAAGTRALLVIDALNESEDPGLWKRSLGGMIAALRAFPFVSLALSTRRDFMRVVIPEGLSEGDLPTVVHQGFGGHEDVATARIFDHFNITTPDVPLLDPEFSNPLFVITLAEALHSAGRTTLPPGAHTLRWVFDLRLDGINSKLSGSLDFDPSNNLVQSACRALASAMAAQGIRLIEATKAKALVDSLLPGRDWARSLFRALVDEDVINRYQLLDPQAGSGRDMVRFTYDRFADHHIARAALSANPSAKALRTALAPKGKARTLVIEKRLGHAQPRRGILTALAIELPEDTRFRCELNTVLTDPKIKPAVLQALIESVQWRSPDSIPPATLRVLREHVRGTRSQHIDAQIELLEWLLKLTMRPFHPLNAEFLNEELRRTPMPERDYWWSRPLTKMRSVRGTVMRLVNWMASAPARSCTEQSAMLAATTAAWFCATSNRAIRDQATKAIVSMLMLRPRIMTRLIEQFSDVDDLYVVERVLAAAYGVALRTHNLAELEALGRRVHELYFVTGLLPVHLLARNYACGILDCVTRRCGVVWPDSAPTTPPFSSDWPGRISRPAVWKRKFERAKKNRASGLRRVWWSIFHDDFGTYVLRPGCDWLTVPLRQAIPEILLIPDSASLTERLEEEHVVTSRKASSAPLPQTRPYASPSVGPRLEGTNGRPLTRIERDWRLRFPLDQMKCMVMDDVVALGYQSRLDEDVEPGGDNGEYVGRGASKVERLGKKYQWLAHWRTQARIADHFHYEDEIDLEKKRRYEGPWQISHGRDIDPSCLLRRLARGHFEPDRPAWWAPFDRADFGQLGDDVTWIQNESTVPTAAEVREATSPSDGRRWIVCDLYTRMFADLRQGARPEEGRRREILVNVTSVFVHSNESAKLVRWLNTQRRTPDANAYRLLPERPHLHRCFLGEFPNSRAWNAQATPYYQRDPWGPPSFRDPPVSCSLLADGYFDDDDLDSSRDQVLEFTLPSAELFNELHLRHAAQDGHFEDATGRLIAWDPSVTQRGPRALLIDKDALAALARAKGYHIVQLIHGEKRAPDISHSEGPYLGILMFSGVSVFDGSTWKGSVDARFDAPRL